jgi:hypothetical protein
MTAPPPMLTPRNVARALQCVATARPADLRFAARAWLLAPIIEASLASAGLRPTLKLVGLARRIGGRPSQRASARVDLDRGRAWTSRAFAMHPLQGLCLARSLVQHMLHTLDGTPSRLVVGVRRGVGASGLEAHAWVTHPDDRDPAADGFQEILSNDATCAAAERR